MKKNLITLLFIFSCLGAHAQLGYWWNDVFMELIPDASSKYNFVQATDDQSLKNLKDLLAGKRITEDNAIIRYEDNMFFVLKDHALPEGDYYVSEIYKMTDIYQKEMRTVWVMPIIIVLLKDGFKIDDILEHLDSHVTLELSGESVVDSMYVLLCHVKTSEEVLEDVLVLNDLYQSGNYGISYYNPKTLGTTVHPNDLPDIYAPSDKNEDNLLYSRNFEGVYAQWSGTDCFPDESSDPIFTYEGTDEGLAITVSQKQEQIWESQLMIVPDGSFNLEENHDYFVRLTLKVPSDGTYQVNMGTWTNNFQNQVAVTASDDFQVIDVEFPFLGNGAEQTYSLEGCHVLFQCGWMVGTTVLKKIEVYEKVGSSSRDNSTSIKTIKAPNEDGAIYNLAGQRVDASDKGGVSQNGKKRLAR